MKATINGVALEGTPEEIIQYQKLLAEKNAKEQYEKYKYDMKKFIKHIENITDKKPVVFGNPDLL
jgi:hypothetical protein